MITHHLDKDIVAAYAHDLLARLGKVPQVWVMIGPSGVRTLKRIISACKDELKELEAVTARYNRTTETIEFPDEPNIYSVLNNRSVIVVDSVVNTGATLMSVVHKIEESAPSMITTYAVAVQSTSNFIPNYFSLLVGSHDRVLFVDGEEKIQNNRFRASGIFRRLQQSDLDKPMLNCGKNVIDRTMWADYWYELQTDSSRNCFLFEEKGEILGFISYSMSEVEGLFISEVAVDKKAVGNKIGHDLIRWAENHARHKCCGKVSLWAVEDKVSYYGKLNFKDAKKEPMRLGNEDGKLVLMTKDVVSYLGGDR